jgi:hypothetical protein
MATIEIELYVDSEGAGRGVIDGNESHDYLDHALAVRMVKLIVEVPEPKAQEIKIQAPEVAEAAVSVKIAQ